MPKTITPLNDALRELEHWGRLSSDEVNCIRAVMEIHCDARDCIPEEHQRAFDNLMYVQLKDE